MVTGFFNRSFWFNLVFFWLFMATILMLIDWRNGIHAFEAYRILDYYLIWLLGGFIYASLNQLLKRWFIRKK